MGRMTSDFVTYCEGIEPVLVRWAADDYELLVRPISTRPPRPRDQADPHSRV
jgi:hypothetical protein